MVYYAVSVFLSALLLFQIQPMIAKYILPWFGGTPAVWSTVQLFFQVLLTGGYAYAHWLTKPNGRRGREVTHLVLLGLVIAQLLVLGRFWASPIMPDPSWKPQGEVNPIWEIFKLLLISVGPAYFLLSTNSPLMQAWFNRILPDKSPYVLYALSNAGSLVGLISYPTLVEPQMTVQQQGILWSAGWGLFALLAAYGTVRVQRWKVPGESKDWSASAVGMPPSPGIRALWILFSACASTLLLATTSQITQEVAVIPFLWVLPLTLYLFSFILAFSSERWYSRPAYLALFSAVSFLFVRVLYTGPILSIPLQLLAYSLTLFIACMVCHGELFRLRPEPGYLTNFYLLVSVGGALGGVFVNFIAPFLFKGYGELPLGIVLCWALLLAVENIDPGSRRSRLAYIFMQVWTLSSLILLMVFAVRYILQTSAGSLFGARNFYGVLRVQARTISGTDQRVYALVHGITLHGLQFQGTSTRDAPTAYYYEKSGIGLAIINHPRHGQGMKVGVAGLGVGTLAAYGQPGDTYRFYEINPIVIDLAEGEGGFFSFLSDSKARIEIVPGDARVSMEDEVAQGNRQNFDVLALDTFNSDSIPVHLLDKEALAVYLQELQPDGILAIHITNTFLDLKPVVYGLAQYYHLNMALVESQGDGMTQNIAIWALLSPKVSILDVPAISSAATSPGNYSINIPLWTDDYSNLWQVLVWH